MARKGKGHRRERRGTPGPAQNASPGRSPTIPWWIPGVVFVVATVVLFAEFIFSDAMLVGHDSLSLGYMARAYFAERLQAGDFPLWSPRLLGGIPFVEAIAGGDSIYPTSLLYTITEAYRALGWKLVLHVLAAGFFMYGWLRSLELARAPALIGGLAWLLAPVMVTLVLPGNDGKLMVAALTPLVFWAAESLFRSPGPSRAAAVAGAVALVSLTTQFQTAYFLFGSVGAYALFRAVQLGRAGGVAGEPSPGRRAGLALGLFLTGALLGAGMAAVQILPAAQYVTESSRRTATTVDATPAEAIAYSSSWSFHPEEVVALAVPEFVGNSDADARWGQGTYWGRNGIKLNHEYLGITVLVLALFALFGPSRRALRLFFLGLGGIWLLFALGAHTPVWRIFYEVVPGISLFRVPALAAFLVSFAASTLFALGAADLLGEAPEPGAFPRRARGRAVLVAVGLLLVGLMAQSSGFLTSFWTAMVYPQASDRTLSVLASATPFITRGFGLAFLLAGLVALVIWAAREDRIPPLAVVLCLGLLLAVDLGRIDRPFIQTLDFYSWAAENDNTRFLQTAREAGPPFRVADLRGDDQAVDLAMFGVDLVAGHHPNDLARYRELLGLAGSQRTGANTRNPNVLRMMNTKYLLWPDEAAGGPPYPGAVSVSSARTGSGVEAVYEYPGLERAWVVGNTRLMDDDEAAAYIPTPAFDPSREAIVADPGLGGRATTVRGTVEWTRDEPELRELTVRTDAPGFLIVSENWFPGWEAEIDGRPAEVHRVNLTLQGVEIGSAGDHDVVLRYTAPTVRSAFRVTLASTVATLLLLLAPLARRGGQPSSDESGPDE